jgi:DNA-binding NarL/FixJ family response regulator
MCIEETDILAVGITDKGDVLKQLPVKLALADTAREALSCLRWGMVYSLASRWELPDMTNGELLRRITSAKPEMPTMALIECGNKEQEIAAKMLGVTLVLPQDIDDNYFYECLCQLLGFEDLAQMKGLKKPEYSEGIYVTQRAWLQSQLSTTFSSNESWVCQPVGDHAPLSDPAENKRSVELLR